MTKAIKTIKVGNSVGVVLSRDILERLRIELGDVVYFSENPHGFQLSANDPAFLEAMTAADRVMKDDRDILAVLAK